MMLRYAIACLAVVWTVSLWADDALTKAIDPYDQADQKVKFIKATGNDGELDQKKFLADQKTGEGLILPFEKWETAVAFDKNKNGSLDWFEFEAYRQAMRAAVLAGFDKNKDGKLTGDERTDALKALKDGKVTIKPGAETPRGAIPPGPVSPTPGGAAAGDAREATSRPTSRPAAAAPAPAANAEATARNQGRPMGPRGDWQPPKDVIEKYDKDGDGKLNEAEMTAWRRDMMWDNMPKPMKDFTLRNFENVDGKLTDEGWQAAEKYQRESMQMMQNWQTMVFDPNATEAQRREIMQKWAPTGMKIGLAMQKRMADAGGQEAFMQKITAGMMRYTERFEKQALADHDGKPSDASRTAMLKAIDADMRERVKKAAADPNGKLEPAEGEKLFMEIMDEFLKDQ